MLEEFKMDVATFIIGILGGILIGITYAVMVF